MKLVDQNTHTQILKTIPSIELYNEQKIHNKVNCNAFTHYRIIPKGRKGLLIFTQLKGKFQTFFLEIKKNSISNSFYCLTCFNEEIGYGKANTILYGTLPKDEPDCFVIEDILYYKHKKVSGKSWCDKYSLMSEIFEQYIHNELIFKTQMIITTCFIQEINGHSMYNLIDATCENYDYSIFSIQYLKQNDYDVYTQIYIPKQREINGIFTIKPHLQNDIYEGFDINNKSIGVLCVPDYKTSVLLNNYFRNIKENRNLDLLEESDDEEEFENINLDKFVDLDKSMVFECKYSEHYEMWVPVDIHKDYMRLSNIDHISFTKNQNERRPNHKQYNAKKYQQKTSFRNKNYQKQNRNGERNYKINNNGYTYNNNRNTKPYIKSSSVKNNEGFTNHFMRS
jgi:hypothetical protein